VDRSTQTPYSTESPPPLVHDIFITARR